MEDTKSEITKEMIKQVNKYLWDFYNLHSLIIAIAGYGDEVGKILYANRWAHRILRYEPGTLIGQNVRVLMHNEEDRNNHDNYLKEYLAQERLGMVLNEGRVVEAKDTKGNLVPNYLSVIEKDMDGRRVFIAFMTDLTAQTEAMEESNKAASVKAAILASMSHEIRTPMNSIIGRADLLKDANLTEEEREHVKTIIDSGENLIKIVNDVLDLSKIESGKIHMDNICFNIHELLHRVINIMKTNAQRKNLSLNLSIFPEVPALVFGDPTRLNQILINLLSNAIKFTEKGEVICTVKIDRHTDNNAYIRFSVKDTGIGISKDKLSLIFEAFTQSDSSMTRKFGGTGLGLSITRDFVELMRGSIWVESEVGRGSDFIFVIPLETSAECVLDKDNEDDKIVEADLNINILLVEDNEQNRNLISLFLKGTKCSIDLAENGKIGLEKYKTNKYDLVLMDIEMPEMDGYTATEKIREWEKEGNLERTPVIIISAHALGEYKEEAFKRGADGFMDKPSRKKDILLLIKKYLNDVDSEKTNTENQGPESKSLQTQGVINSAQKITLEINEDFEELIPDYLNSIENDMEEIKNSLHEDNFEQIRITGHSIKGSGGGYGFNFITEAGASIERAAKDNDRSTISTYVDKIKDYMDRIEITYVEKDD